MSFSPIPELLEEIRAGRMVVIVDDEDRENEGDLIMAAELVRPQDINFMVTHARGLVCLSLTRERCRQLGLPPMVRDNTSQHHTNFTVSIEAAEGVTTGISAYDRAHTVRTAVRPDASAAARQPFRNIHFANTDLSGIPLFEEAFDHGLRAAEEVLRARSGV